MPTAYGYCRVSHEDSTESGLGIAAQIHAIRTWWRQKQESDCYPNHAWSLKGWCGEKENGSDTDDGLFIDQSVSAFKVKLAKRPAGERLVDILQPGDLVVFARLDRAFRGVSDFAVTIERWMKRGVLVQFINPQVDLTNAYGMAFAQIAAVFAQLDSAIKSERMKEAQSRGRHLGRKMGRFVSFGWKKAPNGEGMIPDEEERVEIKLIAEFRDIDKLSYAEISDQLEIRRCHIEHRPAWPNPPYRGSENRKWTAGRVQKAYKARHRVPKPESCQ